MTEVVPRPTGSRGAAPDEIDGDGHGRDRMTWICHDLRSPVAAIQAMAEALEDGVVTDPATVARYLGQIRRDAERLGDLVDDLFDLSRGRGGPSRPGPAEVAVADVVAAAVGSAAAQAQLQGVTVVERLEAGPSLLGCRDQLTRVLHNLLDNAIRHTRPGGRVEVVVTADVATARLSVSDACGGLAPPLLRRLAAGGPTTSVNGRRLRPGPGDGHGLGLVIARALVEAHRGAIEVANTAGGCRFTVLLPTTADRPANPPAG